MSIVADVLAARELLKSDPQNHRDIYYGDLRIWSSALLEETEGWPQHVARLLDINLLNFDALSERKNPSIGERFARPRISTRTFHTTSGLALEWLPHANFGIKNSDFTLIPTNEWCGIYRPNRRILHVKGVSSFEAMSEIITDNHREAFICLVKATNKLIGNVMNFLKINYSVAEISRFEMITKGSRRNPTVLGYKIVDLDDDRTGNAV